MAKSRLTLLLNEDQIRKLKVDAAANGMPVNQWVVENMLSGRDAQVNAGGTPEERFKLKYAAFLEEVKKARDEGWKSVPYDVGCDLIGDLNNYV